MKRVPRIAGGYTERKYIEEEESEVRRREES